MQWKPEKMRQSVPQNTGGVSFSVVDGMDAYLFWLFFC
jgi:hypothetical protein